MATDYDAPRGGGDEGSDDSIEELKGRRSEKTDGKVDIDEFDAAEGLELPGADLSGEDLTVQVLPKQQDEFTCSNCFMVRHRSQLAGEDSQGRPVCKECSS